MLDTISRLLLPHADDGGLMSGNLHRTVTRYLREAGFEVVRAGKHVTWKSADNKRGVAISKNIRDKNLARSLLRSVGISVRL